MLTEYIQAAMQRAVCEWLPEDEVYYCSIPDTPGVWATGQTEAACRTELQEVLEDWIAVGLAHGQHLPALGEAEIRVNLAG